MKDLTVLQAKRYGIFSCTADTLLIKAARKMVDEDISGLVVTDQDGGLAGILTRTDLLRAYHTESGWADEPVEKYMNREVVHVTPQDRLSDVARLLLEHQIHRVVIVQKENQRLRPVGVISDADIVYHMTKED